MKKLLIVLAFLCSCSYADEYRYSHDWAHLGTSYALHTVTYGVVKQLGLSQRTTLAISTLLTFSVTFLYEVKKPYALDVRTIGMNALGQGLSAGTILVFDF